jgi:hypothetical protein
MGRIERICLGSGGRGRWFGASNLAARDNLVTMLAEPR